MSYPHINVEEAFDELVREYGTACVLRDVLPKDVSFQNADYIFHSEKVVAELKCLSIDNSDDKSKQTELESLIGQNFSEGKIKSKEFNESNWKQYPADLQRKIGDIFSHSIRARVKKANVQIRETKRQLELGSYAGMLIIVNDGLTSIPPAAFMEATRRGIQRDTHNIDLFIYLTVNLFSKFEGNPFPVVYWMPLSMVEPSKIDELFLNGLRMLWQEKINRKMGITHSVSHEVKDEDMGAFWRARHFH